MLTYFPGPPLCDHAFGKDGEFGKDDLSDMPFYSGCRRIKPVAPVRVIPIRSKEKNQIFLCNFSN